MTALAAAHYRDQAPPPTLARRCSICRHYATTEYAGHGTCILHTARVYWLGVCDKWEARRAARP